LPRRRSKRSCHPYFVGVLRHGRPLRVGPGVIGGKRATTG
jgi:hypothetical protein